MVGSSEQIPRVREALTRLAGVRPLFHSEADFQHALAFELHSRLNLELRLERRFTVDGNTLELDILAGKPPDRMAIELKYRPRSLKTTFEAEEYWLKDQGAYLIGRYEFWDDVRRVETLVRYHQANIGCAIFLTNDPAYWQKPRPSAERTKDHQFRIHEDRETRSGILAWANPKSGTAKLRPDLELSGGYSLHWQIYSKIPDGEFRYLMLEIAGK